MRRGSGHLAVRGVGGAVGPVNFRTPLGVNWYEEGVEVDQHLSFLHGRQTTERYAKVRTGLGSSKRERWDGYTGT